MIINRPNFKQAYLVFAANGEIRFNKKTIGIWKKICRTMADGVRDIWASSYKAEVHFQSNNMVSIKCKGKLQLMIKVARAIPDTMLTPATALS